MNRVLTVTDIPSGHQLTLAVAWGDVTITLRPTKGDHGEGGSIQLTLDEARHLVAMRKMVTE